MNCKPGDLAVVVKTRAGTFKSVGRIVRVLRLADAETCEWQVEFRGQSGWYALDENLRPIRPQGDDATDETLLWLPVPTKEVA